MDTSDQRKQQLFQILQSIKADVDADPQKVPEHLFTVLEAVSKMFYKWRHSNGSAKWSRSLISANHTAALEQSFQTAEPFLHQNQLGGGWSGGSKATLSPHQQGRLHKSYNRLQHYVQTMNTQWDEISNALGVVAPENRKIPTKAIGFVMTAIETLSIWIQTTHLDDETYGFFLSLCRFLQAAVKGDSEAAVLNAIGLFNSEAFLSQTGHFFLDVVQLIDPEAADLFLQNLEESTQTLAANMLLWCFQAFAPRNPFGELTVNSLYSVENTRALSEYWSLRLALDLLDIPTSSEEYPVPKWHTQSRRHRTKLLSKKKTRKSNRT